jgi:hypothetical protein
MGGCRVKDLRDIPLDALDLNEAARPSAPRVPQATDADRAKGRQLAMIHAGYLRDMARIAAVIDRIEAGDAPPAHLAQIVLSSNMAENYRAFGSLCGQECRILTMHHNIEEHHMFPEVEHRAPSPFAAIVAKLRSEHKIVHELLERLAAAAHDMMQDPGPEGFAELRAIFAHLHKTVASHFHYEETALEEAIGVYLDGI